LNVSGNTTLQDHVVIGSNAAFKQTSGFYLFPNNSTANVIDSFAVTDFQTAKYTISAKNNSNTNNKLITEITAVYDSANVHSTQFGTIYSSTNFLTFNLDANTTHVRLSATSNSTVTNAYVTLVRTCFK
jgi:hypothetical protein